MSRTLLLLLSLGLMVSRCHVLSASEGECPKGTEVFKSACISLSSPGTWKEASSNCPSLLTNNQEIRERLISLDLAKPTNKSIIVNKIQSLPSKELFNEIWVLEKDSVLFGTKSNIFLENHLLDPYVFSRWKWGSNQTQSTCLTLDLRTQKFRERSCSSDDPALKFPTICAHPKIDKNDNCPEGFNVELNLNATCVSLTQLKVEENDWTWSRAEKHCSTFGPNVSLLSFTPDLPSKLKRWPYCGKSLLPLNKNGANGKTNISESEGTALNLTTGVISSLLANDEQRFKCIFCQTYWLDPPLDQTLSLIPNGKTKLLLQLSNYIPRENFTLVCRTDSSAADSTSDNFNEIVMTITSLPNQSTPYVVSQSIPHADKFYVRMIGGDVALPTKETKDITKDVTFSVKSVMAGIDLEISFEASDTGNYWCIGTNIKNGLPMYTEKVFLQIPSNVRYLRYVVLVETSILKSKIRKLLSTTETTRFTADLAKALKIDDGVLELKRISNMDTHLLFHITLPPDHGPIRVVVDNVNTTSWRIVSVRHTEICASTNITSSRGVTYSLPTTSIGATYTSDDACVERSCEGDYFEGAYWSEMKFSDHVTCAQTSPMPLPELTTNIEVLQTYPIRETSANLTSVQERLTEELTVLIPPSSIEEVDLSVPEEQVKTEQTSFDSDVTTSLTVVETPEVSDSKTRVEITDNMHINDHDVVLNVTDSPDNETSSEENYNRGVVVTESAMAALRHEHHSSKVTFVTDIPTTSSEDSLLTGSDDIKASSSISQDQTTLHPEEFPLDKIEEFTTYAPPIETMSVTSVDEITVARTRPPMTTPEPEASTTEEPLPSTPTTWPTSPDESADWIEKLTQTVVPSSQLTNVAALVHNVLNNPGNLNTIKVLDNLDTILAKMVLDSGSDFAADVHPTVATLVADYQESNPLVGISLTSEDGADVIAPIRGGKNTTYSDQNEVTVLIEKSLLYVDTRLAFVVLLNGDAFPEPGARGRVVNVALTNKTTVGPRSLFSSGQYVDIIFRKEQIPCQTPACAFWDAKKSSWSRAGCELQPPTKLNADVCRCNHVTYFAEIITGGSDISPGHRLAMEILSIIGSVLSLLGLFVIGVTAITFKSWRKETGNQILASLSAALGMNLIMYLLVYGGVGGTGGPGCIAVGALLHYSVLACFCWMLVMSVLQINRLLTMSGNQTTRNLLLKASIFGWLVPLVFVLIALLAWKSTSYTSNTSMGFERGFCYPCGTSFYVTLAAPVGLIVLANFVIFSVIMCRICSFFGWGKLDVDLKRHGISDGIMAMRRLRTMIFLFIILGLTWTFGFLGQYLFFAYLFCLTAPLQGFAIFVFFFVIESKSRTHWKTLYSFDSKTGRSKHSDTKDASLLESLPLREDYQITKKLDEVNGEPVGEVVTTLRRPRETPSILPAIFDSVEELDGAENTYRSFGHPDFVEEDKNGKRLSLIESRNRNVFQTFK